MLLRIWDNGSGNTNRTPDEEHSIDATTQPPRPQQVAFDDHRLVANAGLLLPATLALHLGLPQLVDRRLDLGRAPGQANPGDKMLTLVASALAGGDCIDDADALRAGGTARVLGCVVKAPSTPRFREGRLWGRSCAASVGATSVSWTG